MKKLASLLIALVLVCSMGNYAHAQVVAPDKLEYQSDGTSFNFFTAQELGIREGRCVIIPPAKPNPSPSQPAPTVNAYFLDKVEYTKIAQGQSNATTTKTEYLQIDISNMQSGIGEVEILVRDLDSYKIISAGNLANNSTGYLMLTKGLNYVVYARAVNNPGVVYISLQSIFL